jgi:K+-sensing histidine kinase KdpD
MDSYSTEPDLPAREQAKMPGEARRLRRSREPRAPAAGKQEQMTRAGSECSSPYQSATRLEVINEIGRVLSATTDLPLLYRVIHEQVNRVMDATVFYIALYNEQRSLLAFPYTADQHQVDNVFDDLIEYPLSEGPTSWVVRERRPLIVTQADDPVQSAGRPFGDEQRKSQSAIHMPMLRSERMIGVLSVQSYRPNAYSDEDMRTLEAIASQAAVTIENARLIQRLQDAYARQRELDRLKDEFIVTASHELRTPLATVMGYLYLLKDFSGELDSIQANEFIIQALNSAEQLNMMVNNLMDASRLQGEHTQSTLQPVALAPLVQSLVASWVSISGRRNLHVAISEGLIVLADSELLRQVLGNLLSNAVRYTPKDQPILIQAEPNLPVRGQAMISVIDHGPGIAVGNQQRIFEKFVRLEETRQTSMRGTGLGLYICRQLVNAMGGEIWVESEEGLGAAFHFTLRMGNSIQQPFPAAP